MPLAPLTLVTTALALLLATRYFNTIVRSIARKRTPYSETEPETESETEPDWCTILNVELVLISRPCPHMPGHCLDRNKLLA
jgi:uncharacterized membrane protein